MIDVARENGLKVMLGCMVETSVGITNASHLAGEVDFVDLDGNLLIKNDPYSGVIVNDGRLVLPKRGGIGLTLNSDLRQTKIDLHFSKSIIFIFIQVAKVKLFLFSIGITLPPYCIPYLESLKDICLSINVI